MGICTKGSCGEYSHIMYGKPSEGAIRWPSTTYRGLWLGGADGEVIGNLSVQGVRDEYGQY
jgi:hypothetical protein